MALNEDLKETNLRIREINEKLLKATEKAQEKVKYFLLNIALNILILLLWN